MGNMKTVKINETNYRAICAYAGELQKMLGEPISVDRALSYLFSSHQLSDLAGTWDMSEKEAKEMMASLKKGWSAWKTKSV